MLKKKVKIYKITDIGSWNLYIDNQDDIPVLTETELLFQELSPGVYRANIKNSPEDENIQQYNYCSLDGVFAYYTVNLLSNLVLEITVDTRVDTFKKALDELKPTVSTWNLSMVDYISADNIENVKPYGEAPLICFKESIPSTFIEQAVYPKMLIMQFVPTSDFKIKIGNSEYEVDPQYINLAGTVTALVPIREIQQEQCYQNSSIPWYIKEKGESDYYTGRRQALYDFLRSANLKSAHVLPWTGKFYTPVENSTNSEATYDGDVFTLAKPTTVNGDIILLTKGFRPEIFQNTLNLQRTGFTGLEKILKLGRIELNVFEAILPITPEDVIQYSNQGQLKLNIWIDFGNQDMYLCYIDYNGIFNRIPMRNSLPVVVDSWQQYVASNPNYKDMLYNVPSKKAQNQYELNNSFNNQNYHSNTASNALGAFTTGNPFDLPRAGFNQFNAWYDKDIKDRQNRQEYQMNLANIKLSADAIIAQQKGGANQIQYSSNSITPGFFAGNNLNYLGLNRFKLLSYMENALTKLLFQNGVELVGSVNKSQFNYITNQNTYRIALSDQQIQLFKYYHKLKQNSIQQLFYCSDYDQFINSIETQTLS